MSIEKSACPHYRVARMAAPKQHACEVCGVEAPVRVCLECGHVGCCESTQGHAKAHALAAKHPLIRQLPLREASFTWCYECGDYLR